MPLLSLMEPEAETLDMLEYLLLLLLLLRVRRRHRQSPVPRLRTMWVRPIYQRRHQRSELLLVHEMRALDHPSHFKYLRMTPSTFDYLLQKIGPVMKHRRRYRSTIRPNLSNFECLVITLRFLATGASQRSLSFAFRLAACTVHHVVLETCQALWQVLRDDHLRVPQTAADWLSLSGDFERLWNFPHCIGAIDGKHVMIRCPPKSGSTFFNYKGRFSVQLLAVCDAHYRFILADIGCEGRRSDGGVFGQSAFGQALQDGTLVLPAASEFGGLGVTLPYCMVGDEAFPLRTYLMRPYPGRGLGEDKRVFNYRLSRARRTIENAFGIMAARWRLFLQPINADPDNVVTYIKATLCLHNLLRSKESSVYCPPGFGDSEDSNGDLIPGEWRLQGTGNGLLPIGTQGGNRYTRSAKDTRDWFRVYFLSERGQLSWQYTHVRSTGRQSESDCEN